MIAQGVYDGVNWEISDNGELFIGKAGEEQTFINRGSRSFSDWPWSSYYSEIKSVKFVGEVNGNGSHKYMFHRCRSLVLLDLSNNFNTSGVTDMSYMFSQCESLISLDLSSFNTSSVIDMNHMFDRCESLISLNLSGFNTCNVTNMRHMFSECFKLTSLHLNNFNTSSVTNMDHMFAWCYLLDSLDLSDNFKTSNVTNMACMFIDCSSLKLLDLSSFDISNVTNMDSMFRRSSIRIPIFYVSNYPKEEEGTVIVNISVTNMFESFDGEIFLMRPENVVNPTEVKRFWRGVAETNSNVHFEYDDTDALTSTMIILRGKFRDEFNPENTYYIYIKQNNSYERVLSPIEENLVDYYYKISEEGEEPPIYVKVISDDDFIEDDTEGNVIKIIPNISIKQNNIPDETEVGPNVLTNIELLLKKDGIEYSNYTVAPHEEGSLDLKKLDIDEVSINNAFYVILEKSNSEKQYSLETILFDRREDVSFPFKIIIPGIFAMIEFRKGGHGMSIGKVCEQDGLEISIPTAIGEGLFPPTQPNNPQLVVDPSGDLNPSEQGWYEYDPIKQKYYKTIDTIVNNQKNYYEAEEEKIDLNNYQLIIGQYNEKSDDGILVVGNGTQVKRSNSFIIDKNGDFRIKDRFRIKDEDKNNASFLDMEILEKKEKFYNFIDKEEFGYPRHKPKEDPFTQTITFDCPKITLQESLENKFYIAIYINHYAFTYGEYELTSKTLIEEYFIEKGVPITQENFSYDGNTTIEYEVESIPNMTGSSLRLEFNVSYCVENRVPAFNFGINNSAEGKASSVFGTSLESSGDYSFTIGKYNALIPYSASSDNLKYAFVIGNGENEEGQITRSNALTVDWQGKIDISGTPYSSSWVQQRDFAQIKRSTIPNSNGMFPFVDAKTPSGDWAIATYGEGFYVSYVTDVDYDSGTNTQTAVLSISNSGAVNASGQYQVHGRPYISTELKNWDNVSIAKGAFSQFSYPVEKAGYTPIGIAGFDIDNASSSGTQANNVWFGACRLSGNNVIFQLRNHNDSTAAKVKLWATILYRAI